MSGHSTGHPNTDHYIKIFTFFMWVKKKQTNKPHSAVAFVVRQQMQTGTEHTALYCQNISILYRWERERGCPCYNPTEAWKRKLNHEVSTPQLSLVHITVSLWYSSNLHSLLPINTTNKLWKKAKEKKKKIKTNLSSLFIILLHC